MTNDTGTTGSNLTTTSTGTNDTAQSVQNTTATRNSAGNDSSSASSSNETTSNSSNANTTQIASADNGATVPVQVVAENQTITASTWQVNGTSMDVSFDMTPVLTRSGVYTIYAVLQDDNGSRFNATSYSIYYNDNS